MPVPTTTIVITTPRARMLAAAAEVLLAMSGEPADLIVLVILGFLREQKIRIRLESTTGEVAFLLGYAVKLDEDDLAILRALADAEEPLQSRGIARALSLDEEGSTIRLRLAPKAKLRAGGYISHLPSEGYTITEKGRNALDSLEAE